MLCALPWGTLVDRPCVRVARSHLKDSKTTLPTLGCLSLNSACVLLSRLSSLKCYSTHVPRNGGLIAICVLGALCDCRSCQISFSRALDKIDVHIPGTSHNLLEIPLWLRNR